MRNNSRNLNEVHPYTSYGIGAKGASTILGLINGQEGPSSPAINAEPDLPHHSLFFPRGV